MDIRKLQLVYVVSLLILVSSLFLLSCEKSTDLSGPPYDINNSLTLFKLDNSSNQLDVLETDTVSSMSGLKGKYIPVAGNAGAVNGLGKITLELLNTNDSLLTRQNITEFFRPEYHVFNTQLSIPNAARGQVYKVKATSYDLQEAVIESKSFLAVDVLTCDPVAACIVQNQITIMLETPPSTPDDATLYIFGSLNGWGSRDEPQFAFHKNPDMPNCYCLSIPYAPGFTDWQLTQIFVSRGTWDTQAVTMADADVFWDYTTTAREPIWKIKVEKWRDL